MIRKAKNKRGAAARQGLITEVGHANQAFQRATDGFDDAVGRKLGLNPTDLRCLDWLTEGEMSAGELAAATGLSGAATTTLLDRLERKGYIRRERDASDRRRIRVSLTAEGAARLGALYGPLAHEGRLLLEALDDDHLAMMVEFLECSTAIVDRHRERIRAELASPPDSPEGG